MPQEPAVAAPVVEELVEESSPPAGEDAPSVDSVPVPEGPKVYTRPDREPLVKNQE